jgi:hypothetical protein
MASIGFSKLWEIDSAASQHFRAEKFDNFVGSDSKSHPAGEDPTTEAESESPLKKIVRGTLHAVFSAAGRKLIEDWSLLISVWSVKLQFASASVVRCGKIIMWNEFSMVINYIGVVNLDRPRP